MQKGVMIEFDKEIFKKAIVFGVYLKGQVIRWLYPENIDFTDLGNVIYWDGAAWMRKGKDDVMYLIIPENTLDLFPKAEVIGRLELEQIKDDYYIATVQALERVITDYLNGKMLDIVTNEGL